MACLALRVKIIQVPQHDVKKGVIKKIKKHIMRFRQEKREQSNEEKVLNPNYPMVSSSCVTGDMLA